MADRVLRSNNVRDGFTMAPFPQSISKPGVVIHADGVSSYTVSIADCVPEGRLRIAQRFIAGIRIGERPPVRLVGTIETNDAWFKCPYGTPRAI